MNRYEVVADTQTDFNILIVSTNDAEKANKAKQWAKDNNFLNVRLSDAANLEKPDFIKSINHL